MGLTMTKRRTDTLALVLTLALILSCSFFWCMQKKGLSLDETYSYGLANSDGAPFVNRIYDDDLDGHVFSHEALNDYVSVDPNERFDYASVYYNQTQDVHPPLFYFLLHTVCSFFPGQFSLWFGLSLNLVVYAATIVTLYLLAKLVTDSTSASAAACLLYGLSQAALSSMLMIRMYLLLAFWTVLLTYLVVRYLRKPFGLFYPLVALVAFAGMMTQYFFVIYALLLCATTDVVLLHRRQLRKALGFSASVAIGIGAMLLAFPSWWDQLHSQSTVSLDTVADNAGAGWDSYLPRISEMFSQLAFGQPVVVILCAIALCALAICGLTGRLGGASQTLSLTVLVAVPTLLAFVAIAVIAPYLSLRYAYQLLPLTALVSAALASPAFRRLPSQAQAAGLVVLVTAALFVQSQTAPDYLVASDPSVDEQAVAHGSDACVYVTQNVNPPFTSDLWYLLRFDDVCVVDGPDDPTLSTYLGRHDTDSMTVFVASYPSTPDAEAVLDGLSARGGYANAQQVGEGDFSTIYELSR